MSGLTYNPSTVRRIYLDRTLMLFFYVMRALGVRWYFNSCSAIHQILVATSPYKKLLMCDVLRPLKALHVFDVHIGHGS